MNSIAIPRLPNCGIINRLDIPELPVEGFREHIISETKSGARVANFFGVDSSDETKLLAVLAYSSTGEFSVLSCKPGNSYHAITPECPQVHLFEREIAEQCNVRPEGHPWLKPLRGDSPSFFRVEGEEIHEVAVGPVHAGVIEPGHFRFQCHSEDVFHLEISLGYQHRGVEKAIIHGPNPRTVHYMETLAGDTSIGHTLAYCEAVEALSQYQVPARASALRGIANELERIANHIGDLGALAADVGYLPTASFCGRLRGDILNLTALVCGSRFGRGWLRPGGVNFDLDKERSEELSSRLKNTFKDMEISVNLLWESPSVMARFEDAGIVSREDAEELGLVGVAARACGIHRDVRFEFPAGIYRLAYIPISTLSSGDIFARAYLRWIEIQRSVNFVLEQIKHLPDGPVRNVSGNLARNRLVVSMVEGWRGEICHVAMTDGDGKFERYKIVDPSFHNWTGLAIAMRNQAISDFPLCNKSFNLSYCGHDL